MCAAPVQVLQTCAIGRATRVEMVMRVLTVAGLVVIGCKESMVPDPLPLA